MTQRDVRVAIIGDPSSLQRALAAADTSTRTFAQRLSTVGAQMRSVGSTLTRSLTLPLAGLGYLAYRELAESQRALAQTEAVIESTGGAARRSVEDITGLVTELRDLSGVDDEGIQDMANTLLTFRGIVGPVFDEATRATLDLSVAMDRDMRSSAVMVGRALNDPMRGLSALTRVGVTFTQQQRDAVAAMMYFGDTAGAQRVILQELQTEFGGSAEALGGTLQGRLNRVRQQFEDMSASVLENLLPVLEDLAGVVETLTDAYGDLTPTQQKWVAGLVAAAFVAGPLASVLGLIASGASAVATAMGALAAATGVAVGWVAVIAVALIALGVGLVYVAQHWQTVKDAAATALSNIVGNVPGATTAIRFFRTELGNAREAAARLWQAMRLVSSVSLGAVTAAVDRLASALRSAITSAQSLLETLIQVNAQSLDKVSGPVIPRTGGGAGGAVTERGRAGPATLEAQVERGMRRALARQPVLVAGNV